MTTTRYALIIVCPGEDNTEESLVGTREDAKILENFLLSRIGGAWLQREINTLINPSIDEVNKAVALQAKANFGLTVFSGHGGIDGQGFLNIQLADGMYRYMGLRTLGKQLLIIDCCRAIMEVPIYESLESASFITKQASLKDWMVARSIFDSRINDMPTGHTTLYAADYGELSYMDEDGSYYITSLIRAVEESQSGKIGVISAMTAHVRAKQILLEYDTTQTPQISGMKTQVYPPFGVNMG